MRPREPPKLSQASESRGLRVLLIGSGAREHALAWKLAQDDSVDRLFIFQGNGGTRLLKQKKVKHIFLELTEEAFEDLADVARENKIDLAIVHPVRTEKGWINPIEHFDKGISSMSECDEN